MWHSSVFDFGRSNPRRPRIARRKRPALSLLHLEDRVTPAFDVTSLGLPTTHAVADGNLAAFQVAESDMGADLNGDLDMSDTVLHVYDAATATTTNLGLAIQPFSFRISENLAAFQVAEAAQGDGSLNGDGDATDNVLYVYDAATATINNLGLASTFFLVSGHLLAFSVPEFAQGGVSLNGDGDAIDDVFHVYDTATSTTTNLGAATVVSFSIDGNLVAFGVDEFRQGLTDLNGDGQITAGGGVAHLYNAATATITNLGLDCSGGIVVSGDQVVLTVREVSQGLTDLNGDGDKGDFVVHVHDLATASTTNLGLATFGNFIDGNLMAIRVSEARQGGADLNGDGDATDIVLHVYDAATATTTNLGLESGSITSVSGNLVVFNVSEFRQGGADLNGDGDATVNDLVLHIYDANTATTINSGLAVVDFEHSRNLVAFRVWESAQGGTDFNGDGDATDFVVHVYDASTASTTNLDLASSSLPLVSGDLIAFQVDEFDQGSADLNGDGDMSDTVLHSYDAAAAATTNIGVAIQPFSFRLDGNRLVYAVSESSQGDTDLNGDGDTLDLVAHIAKAVPVNAVPDAHISGPASGVRGQELAYTLTATDSSPADQAANFTFAIDWDGNGSVDETVTAPSGVVVRHTYPASGPNTIRVTATDQNGGTGPETTQPVSIVAAQLQGGDLVVGGTTGNDAIILLPWFPNGSVLVTINLSSVGTFQPTDRVIVYGQSGHDAIGVVGVNKPAYLFGDDGNDVLFGGKASNVLVGGAGHDVLTGFGGRDLLIGGAGSDLLAGGSGDDLLIAGATAFDADRTALGAILAEWSSGHSYAVRVANLGGPGDSGRLNGDIFLRATNAAGPGTATVFLDNSSDLLTGGSGRDWFFANRSGGGTLDWVIDPVTGETIDDLVVSL